MATDNGDDNGDGGDRQYNGNENDEELMMS